MPISNDLFLAILAMDSYNRGYNAGINGLGGLGTGIGNATVSSNSAILGTGVDAAASFFAQSYQLANGDTVISYRGTDQALPSWQEGTIGDIWNGWGIWASDNYNASQARLAAQFYQPQRPACPIVQSSTARFLASRDAW